MALFFPGQTTCALCDGVLTDRDDCVGTSHFIAEGNHPLWRFSDAVMHRACFLRWDHRVAFIDAFNTLNGTGKRMLADGTIRDPLWRRLAEPVIDAVVAIESLFRRRPAALESNVRKRTRRQVGPRLLL